MRLKWDVITHSKERRLTCWMNLSCPLVILAALLPLGGIITGEQPNSLSELDRNPTLPLPLPLNIIVFPKSLSFVALVISEMVLIFLPSLSIPPLPPIGPLPPPQVMAPLKVVKLSTPLLGFLAGASLEVPELSSCFLFFTFFGRIFHNWS